MDTARQFLLSLLLVCCCLAAQGGVLYVDVNGTHPVPPFGSWAAAATNIQHAVNAAVPGDTVLVADGTYATGSATNASGAARLLVTNAITVRSANGRQSAILDAAGTAVGVYLADGAQLTGFTVTHSYGGVQCQSTNALVSDCLIVSNSWGANGGTLTNCVLNGNGGNRIFGAGAAYCVLNHCALSNNATYGTCGGAYQCTLNDCVLSANRSYRAPRFPFAGHGGGAYGSTLNNCLITENYADDYGGGVRSCILSNCVLIGNSSLYGGGATFGALTNCIVTGNLALSTDPNYAAGGGAYYTTLANCIVSSNSAPDGGVSGSYLFNCTVVGNTNGGASSSYVNNCIVYYNSIRNISASTNPALTINYCCTDLLPTNGIGNITNAPLFVDLAGGNLRLQADSPCINAGNNANAPAATDLDGQPRIAGGTVDIGAYEFQTPASRLSYAWLQGFSLPTDGSVDFTDPDGDGRNNWQEWRCGTDPTNAASVLALQAPSNTVSGIVVPWQSVRGITYSLERSTNLPTFLTVATNILGQAGTTTYTDTGATGPGPFFYRVGVQ